MHRPNLDVERILKTLDDHDVNYVLIGGLAAVTHGSSLVTTDVDITPSSESDNLERLAAALAELEAKLRVPDLDYPVDFPLDAHTFDHFTTAAFRTPHGDIDVVLRPDGPGGKSFTYRRLADHSVRQRVFGIQVQISSLDDIIASKQASGRPRDLAALTILFRLRDELNKGGGPPKRG